MTPSLFRVVVADDEPLSRERLRRLLRAEKEVHLVGEASDGPDAVSLIRQERPHIALLDIRLPGLNGFEVLAELGKQTPPAVIFVTAHGEFALRAFEAHATDYLLKPFTPARFREALQRARIRCGAGQATLLPSLLAIRAPNAGPIALRSGPGRVLLSFDDIVYATAANTCCEVFTTTGPLKASESLGSLEGRLPRDRFVRISRFALVNLTHVAALEPKSHGDPYLLLQDNRRLTVARTRRNELLTRVKKSLNPNRARQGLGRKAAIL